MRTRVIRWLVWLAVSGWVSGWVPAVRAEDYRYPKLAPALSVSLPGGWTTEEREGPAQLLLCSPPGDATYTISVLSLPTVGGKDDLRDVLTKVTKAGATGAGMTDITVSAATEGPVGKGARQFTKVTASGKHDGEESAYTYYAFTLPGTGKSYAIGAAGLQAMIDAHGAEFAAVVDSIRPVR